MPAQPTSSASASELMNGQLRALREAVLAISSDLSLAETLKHIVKAAAQTAGAQYAALGVPDEAGETLVEFITTGLTAQEEARLGRPPRGHGVLGIVLHEGKPLRLSNVRQHPRSVGFPPEHPPMTSFLGVPIVHSGKLLGNLYLTNKLDGGDFTDSDQAVIELLASHAANAIQNARLYQATLERSQELQERIRELAAVNAVAAAISKHLDLDTVMAEALDRVLAVSDAEVGEIFLLDETSEDMVLALHRGTFPDAFQTVRRFRRGEGFPGQVALTGQPLVSTHLDTDMRYLRREVIQAGFKSYTCVPLFAKGKVVGTFDLASRNPDAFDHASLVLLSGIGHQIGVAVENARLYKQVAQLAVLEERQRIGMDLHDGVIQSIYAVGLTLEYVNALLADDDFLGATERLKRAIDTLNATIRDIRSYILDLRPRRFEGDDLISGLKRLLAEFKANTLIAVDLNADVDADQALVPQARLALFHIAQEALSNAAKHSRASRLDVRLINNGNEVLLSLRDNGRGFQPDKVERRVGHGLVNMQDRAIAMGGKFTVGPGAGGRGTEVCVSIPKPSAN